MKIKKFKLTISAYQVKMAILLIIGLPCTYITIRSMTYDYRHEPAPLVVSVSAFQGTIISSKLVNGFNNKIQSDVSFDTAMRWNNAILVYDEHPDSKEPGIVIYRSNDKLCGAFEFVKHHVNWLGNWSIEVVVYDAKRQWIVFYPEYNWVGVVFSMAVVLIVGWLITYGIIELIALICKRIKQGIQARIYRKQQVVKLKNNGGYKS